MKNLNEIITKPETKLERLIQIILFPIMCLLCILLIGFVICYFLFGLFILDGIYYIFTGNTIIWKHINNPS